MRKSRFSEEQTAMGLRQAEAGTTVDEVCRTLGVRVSGLNIREENNHHTNHIHVGWRRQ
jgi:hypothetical protein